MTCHNAVCDFCCGLGRFTAFGQTFICEKCHGRGFVVDHDKDAA